MLKKTQFYQKKVLVVGLGVSGRSAAKLLLQLGAAVFSQDQNVAKISPEHLNELHESGLQLILDEKTVTVTDFDFLVVSPGIPQTNSIYVAAREKNVKILGEIELACLLIKERDQKFLAITGTNGKTTVTLLITHVLNSCGIQARSLGNMGVPLTSECISCKPDEVLVVELSSYQLETMTAQVIDAAVILNITPDHLDRYKNMEEYAKSKLHIANCLKSTGRLYIEQNCWQAYSHLLSGFEPMLYGYDAACNLSTDSQFLYAERKKLCEIPSVYCGKKSHDVENLLAAFALCRELGITAEQFMQAAKTFKKPAHRIEFVKNINHVSYFDDSKGTNIDAVIRAVQFLNGQTILIAGGVDKGSAYTPWLNAFSNKVKCICAIGAAARKIESELSAQIPVHLFDSLERAVKYAASIATQGDNVLLSPGCASFDMFRDYAHRGDEFKRIVNEFERGNDEST